MSDKDANLEQAWADVFAIGNEVVKRGGKIECVEKFPGAIQVSVGGGANAAWFAVGLGHAAAGQAIATGPVPPGQAPYFICLPLFRGHPSLHREWVEAIMGVLEGKSTAKSAQESAQRESGDISESELSPTVSMVGATGFEPATT